MARLKLTGAFLQFFLADKPSLLNFEKDPWLKAISLWEDEKLALFYLYSNIIT